MVKLDLLIFSNQIENWVITEGDFYIYVPNRMGTSA